MANNKDVCGSQDRTRIAMGEDHEVDYWTAKFSVSREAVQRAVDAVANSAAAVEHHLKN